MEKETQEKKKQYPTSLTNKQVGELHKAYAKATKETSWSITTSKAIRYAIEQFIKGEK